MRYLRRVGGIVMLGLLAWGVTACTKKAEEQATPAAPVTQEQASPAAPAPEAGGPIRIGAMFDITGPASFLGEPEANTARMIVEEINAQGGVNGRLIELLIEDSQADGTRAVNAAKNLIRQDVLAIVGPSISGNTFKIMDICQQEGVPLISCAAAEKITSPVLSYVFKTPHKDSHAVERIYDYMVEKGIKRIAILSATSAFGAAGRDQLRAKAPAYGLEIVADETYAPTDTDMTAQLTKIKAAAPDALVNWSVEPAQSIVLKNKRDLGMTQPMFQSHGFGNLKYVEAAGDAAEGVIFPAARLLVVDELPDDHPHKALLMTYKTQYESKFGGHVSTFGGHAWDALQLVLAALRSGAVTRDAIRDHIENTQGFMGTAGVFNFSPEDHTGLEKDSFEMLTVKDGRFTLAPR